MELRNQVLLIGNLGNDPIVRDTKNGKVARFSLATSDYYRENGKQKTVTDWHTVVAWNQNAEKVAAVCKKGSEVILSGKLTSHSYDDQNGVKHYVTEVYVNEIICRPRAEKVSDVVDVEN